MDASELTTLVCKIHCLLVQPRKPQFAMGLTPQILQLSSHILSKFSPRQGSGAENFSTDVLQFEEVISN